MKIVFFSDLHFEFWERYSSPRKSYVELCNQLKEKVDALSPDLIINAGDTYPCKEKRLQLKSVFLTTPYIEVLGNHDFYHSSFYEQNETKVIGDNIFSSSTLWTNFRDLDPTEAQKIYNCIADVIYIYGAKSASFIREKFYSQLEFLKNSNADVIITHFPPFIESVAPMYQTDILNRYFVNNLEKKIFSWKKKPKLWICGHTHWKHDYIKEINGHKIQVVCNPCGYPNENYKNFDEYEPYVIEL